MRAWPQAPQNLSVGSVGAPHWVQKRFVVCGVLLVGSGVRSEADSEVDSAMEDLPEESPMLMDMLPSFMLMGLLLICMGGMGLMDGMESIEAMGGMERSGMSAAGCMGVG